MSKAFWLSVALVAVFGFSTAQVMARGGGHGGGHHGGGHHGGGHHAHHSGHQGHHHSGYHTHHGFHHHYHHSNWAHHNRPFSRGWYGRHGGAWGRGWGWGNPWAISTFGATAAWLGLEAAEPIYGDYGTVNNVLTSDTEDADPADAANQPANLDNENQTAPAASASNTPQLTPQQVAAARQLAASGKNDPANDTSFLPLGVFSIAPQGQADASAMVQLAVSKTGIVRGTYYDLLTDHDQPIRGAVDKKSQQVAFTFGDQGKVTFETSLGNLTRAQGGVVAHFENGKSSSWTLARYEHEPTDKATKQNAADESQDVDSDDSSDDASTAESQAEPAVR